MILKTTLWTVSAYTDFLGNQVSVHDTEAEALKQFSDHLSREWDQFYPDDEQPADPRQALTELCEHDGFHDSFSIDSHEVEVKASHKNGPLSLTLEAALCAWEWMLEHQNGDRLAKIWDGLGTAAMRHCSMQAGEIALATYQLMESKKIEFHDSYDWEFVPAVLRRLDWEELTEHNQYNGPAYEPDFEAILTSMMEAEPNAFETHEQRWVDDAKRAADKLWKYSDLVTDHEDSHDYAEDPAAWAKRIGEKYDLTPAETW